MSQKILIVTGEASADLYGSKLIEELIKIDSTLSIFATGGYQISKTPARLLLNTIKFASIGPSEAFKNFQKYISMFRKLISFIHTEKPDLAVLVDLPDFNLRFAKNLKEHKIPVIYFISPQIWAWRKSRLQVIKKYVDKLLYIFHFESEYYKTPPPDATFVGHPLIDIISNYRFDDNFLNKMNLNMYRLKIGIMPGSRLKEIKTHLPIFLDSAKIIDQNFRNSVFLVSCAHEIDVDLVSSIAKRYDNLNYRIIKDGLYDLIRNCDVVIVASGTATLETAIIGTPMVVVYKLSPITAGLAKLLVRLDSYSLVNIVAGKKIVPECYQSDAKSSIIANHIIEMLKNNRLNDIRQELYNVKEKLGKQGAIKRTASEIVNFLKNKYG